MNSAIKQRLERCDTTGWDELSIPFGDDHVNIQVPRGCDLLRMGSPDADVLKEAEIRHGLSHPIQSPTLAEIIASKEKPPEESRVCVTVSDITRPIPYKGPDGVLPNLLGMIEATGVKREHITILIGNGMHRPSTLEERVYMYGRDVVDQYRILDHDCEDMESMVLAARTSKKTEVRLNKLFFEADVRIVTGLVESHFMAGASGGRKGVCPALVNTHTLHKFHGVDFLEHENATNLVLDGNPCHEEALEVALAVGVDFLVNVTLNHELKLVGLYAGDLEAAHQAAVEAIKSYVTIPIPEPYDIVITHGAYVGRNHYQVAKAAVGAMPAVKESGYILMLANNFDEETIGGVEYRTVLHLLKILGPEAFISIMRHADWVFTKDQWQPQMWAKPLRKVGADKMVYCAPQVTDEQALIIPGVVGTDLMPDDDAPTSMLERARVMMQNAVKYAVSDPRWDGRPPTMAFVEEGPYAIPILEP